MKVDFYLADVFWTRRAVIGRASTGLGNGADYAYNV